MSGLIRFDWRRTVRLGLLAGVIALGVSVIGMVEVFSQRDIISGVLSVGHLLLLTAPVGIGYLCARECGSREPATLVSGLIAGLLSALPLIALVLLSQVVDLRELGLVNISPTLIDLLTFHQGLGGSLILMALTGVLGLAGAAVYVMPDRPRRVVTNGMMWALGVGLFSDVAIAMLRRVFGRMAVRLLFTAKGLKPGIALILFIIGAGVTIMRSRQSASAKAGSVKLLPISIPQQYARGVRLALGLLLALALPLLLGTYLTEVADMVGLYILMGLGLNIVVGFAGLLDLGYVAFFAIGAYSMGVLTSQTELGLGLTFWSALPIAVLAAVIAGVVLGVPVLRMRGDYLAIVTLGFGEIIRILALSDFLKPLIGGAQGIQKIPNIPIFGMELFRPEHLYYMILAGCLLAFFISIRLRDARLGRQWMAMREDEDAAEAMGINLVKTKLLAFAIGAGFAGLSGAIFAPKLSAIFPHSFSLMVSINVLCLIIVGGMGSLPGVVVGALILVGLPELLREFSEYRLLIYGLLLIMMMIVRPEGFWPSEIRKRELHEVSSPLATD